MLRNEDTRWLLLRALYGRRWLLILALLLSIGLAGGTLLPTLLVPFARSKLLGAVKQFDAGPATIQNVQVTLLPRMKITGAGLLIQRPGEPPVATVEQVVVEASLWGLLGHPRRVHQISLQGVKIRFPFHLGPPPAHPDEQIRIDTVAVTDAVLVFPPDKPGGGDTEYSIHSMQLRDPSPEREFAFQAAARLPLPPAEFTCEGRFGPWLHKSRGELPFAGTYHLEHADLARFKGIAGTVSSEGSFHGTLQHVAVHGTTKTENFTVKRAGHAIPIQTEFQAVVNGLNGDTTLESVHARFAGSALVASGTIAGVSGRKGKRVLLRANIENARVQDMLAFGVKANAPVTGRTSVNVLFDLPPGPGKVVDRLRLQGQFGIASGRIMKVAGQQKLNELSAKAQGDPKAGSSETALANLRGSFSMRQGVVTLSSLRFSVPGAAATLAGTYRPIGSTINFRGTLLMDAKLSETTTGAKSFFLKLANPFFKQKHYRGAKLPVKVTGTLAQPKVGLNLFR